MTAVGMPSELTVADLGPKLDGSSFGYSTTDELQPLDEIVGQPRAVRAFEIGLGIRQPGYHVFVSGTSGTGRMELARRVLNSRAAQEPVPQDWVYVNNFDNPEEPVAIALPAGQGTRLQRDMSTLIATLLEDLPKAFQREDFSREKEKLRKAFQEKGAGIFAELQQLAREREFQVQQVSENRVLFIPLKEGEPISDEVAKTLSPEDVERIEKSQRELFDATDSIARRQQEIERQLNSDVRQVEREFATRLIEPLLREIQNRYPLPAIAEWLVKLQGFFIRNLERFRRRADRFQAQMETPPGDLPQVDLQDRFLEYQVNVVVDNSEQTHAPVEIEEAPNYRNLFGTIERVVDRFGRVVSNFTRIRAGSLLRASGGYLLLDLDDALRETLVWKHLKRALKTATSRIEVYDPFEMFTIASLRPAPIPLDVKLVVVGHPLLYYLLYLYDDDFRELFRIKAEFDTELPRDQQAGVICGRLVRKLTVNEGVPPFHPDAVAELIWSGARAAGDQRRLSAEFRRMTDLIREAGYWARIDAADMVGPEHVRRAWYEQMDRSSLLAEKIREAIADGTLRIHLGKPQVGCVNGLSVVDLGDFTFGWPVRVTASVGVGTSGIINIERESRLSGRTFDKGLLILEGYLRRQYAQDHPLSLTASLALEQTYGGVDGDSATVAEVLCLLSSLSDTPLRQDVAVTGSVSQRGEVQAIGAVTEKVEGFFDVCQQAGLTGRQGVCIPSANVKHLVPRADVLSAVERGEFHVWPIDRLDEAIAVMLGVPAGSVTDPSSIHGRVAKRLRQMLTALRAHRPAAVTPELRPWPSETERPHDPGPPLPGLPASPNAGES